MLIAHYCTCGCTARTANDGNYIIIIIITPFKISGSGRSAGSVPSYRSPLRVGEVGREAGDGGDVVEEAP